MRVGFDLRPALKPSSARRGVGRFTRELASAIVRQSSGYEFLFYTLGTETMEFVRTVEQKPMFYLPKPSRLNWLFELGLFRVATQTDKLDLFHATDFCATPRPTKTKVVATVHDLIPFLFWEEMAGELTFDYRIALKQGLKRAASADHILSPTEYSKSDLCRLAEIDPGKVSVVYAACSEGLGPVPVYEARERLDAEFEIDFPFLLYVGGGDYRKNLGFLLKAFSDIKAEGYPGKMVLVGESIGPGSAAARTLREMAQQLGILRDVVFAGFAAESDLCCFYSACDLFVLPSLYEGFGLPLIEAMKCRAPILCSDASCLPEVAGDAAVYFNPSDTSSLVEAFWFVWGNSSRVTELKLSGARRAEDFSWDKTAQRVLSVYDSLL